MLPTFVIGLREGLEAALIVGIVAAFLNQSGRRDLLAKVWLGVGLALVLCLGVGIGLHILSADLPQKQQEGLETVVGAIAVAMVTYMVIWMRRHSRDLKKQLEGAAGSAMASGSGSALVAMAFLAVLREGFETAVFLLAAFNNSSNPSEAGAGAILGVAVAVLLGYGIYRGGVSINLSKFFRFTGVVLVLVAAGLVVSALHTAHEAGWLNSGQSNTVDLSWLVRPGSVQSSLLTGMLGLQPRPVLIELIGWLVYLIPIGLYVAWPPGRSAPYRAVVRIAAPLAAVAAGAAIVLTLTIPGRPAVSGASSFDTTGSVAGAETTVTVIDRSHDRLTVRLSGAGLDAADAGAGWPLAAIGTDSRDGRRAIVYRVTGHPLAEPVGLAPTMTLTQVQTLNGGRLPLGVRVNTEKSAIATSYRTTGELTVWVDDETGGLLDLNLGTSTTVTAALSIGVTPVGAIDVSSRQAAAASVATAASRAAAADRTLDRRSLLEGYRLAAILLAVFSALAAATSALARRRVAHSDVAQSTANTLPARASIS